MNNREFNEKLEEIVDKTMDYYSISQAMWHIKKLFHEVIGEDEKPSQNAYPVDYCFEAKNQLRNDIRRIIK